MSPKHPFLENQEGDPATSLAVIPVQGVLHNFKRRNALIAAGVEAAAQNPIEPATNAGKAVSWSAAIGSTTGAILCGIAPMLALGVIGWPVALAMPITLIAGGVGGKKLGENGSLLQALNVGVSTMEGALNAATHSLKFLTSRSYRRERAAFPLPDARLLAAGSARFSQAKMRQIEGQDSDVSRRPLLLSAHFNEEDSDKQPVSKGETPSLKSKTLIP